MTIDQISYAGEINEWFVMIKDEQGRFTDNPNWGDGWGWALFKTANPGKMSPRNIEQTVLAATFQQ